MCVDRLQYSFILSISFVTESLRVRNAHCDAVEMFPFICGLTHTKMHWPLGRKSQLSTTNKLRLYKTILKPTWTYGIQIWGTASTSNIEILERFQSKVLCMIVDAP
jgi:hypothetical protein